MSSQPVLDLLVGAGPETVICISEVVPDSPMLMAATLSAGEP